MARTPDRNLRRRFTFWGLASLVAVGVLSACDPPPPVQSLVVTTTFDGGDAVPGDGTCEMTPGGGDCSLRAALDEASAAAGDVAVALPAGTFVLAGGVDDDNGGGDLDVSVTSKVTVTASSPGAVVDAAAVEGGFEVHGGFLGLRRVAVVDAGGDGVVVHAGGAVSASQVSVVRANGHGLLVDAGAAANVLHSTFSSNQGAGVWADGTATLGYTTVTRNGLDGVGGSVAPTLGQSVVALQDGGDDCAVGAASVGGNLDSDGSCGLGAVGDVTADPLLGPLVGPSANVPLPFHAPGEGSPVVDALAPGGSCGGLFASIDQRGMVRPLGAGCDRGAVEAAPLDLVVDAGGDSVDVAPGDGACVDAGGSCTLRAAVGEANAWPGPDVLSFDPSVTTVELTRGGVDEDANDVGDLDVTDDLRIDAAGVTLAATGLPATTHWEPRELCTPFGCRAYSVEVATHPLDSALSVLGASVEVVGLHLDALQPRDAALDLAGGSLQLDAVHLDGVHADVAGVRVDGDATISDSSIRNLLLDGHCTAEAIVGSNAICGEIGGRGWNGAGVLLVDGSLTVERTTLEGNLVGLDVLDGSIDVRSSTLLANPDDIDPITGLYEGPHVTMWALRQAGGDGIVVASTLEAAQAIDQPSGSLLVGASTVDGLDGTAVERTDQLTAAATFLADCADVVISMGHNADEDGTCVGGEPTDRPGAAALLAPLADNGGPTLTRLPAANSSLVDAIPPGTPSLCDAALPADQRGLPRPDGTGCDIGAVDGTGPVVDVPLSFVVDTSVDAVDTAPGDSYCMTAAGDCSLRAAVTEANAAAAADTITFAPGLTEVALSLVGTDEDTGLTGDLDVSGDVTIDGAGVVTVDAAGVDRVLHHHSGALVIDGLGLRGGLLAGDGDHGAGLQVDGGSVVVRGSEVAGNRLTGADADGAGIHVAGGSLELVGSSLVGNRTTGADGDGGGLYLVDGSATIRHSTVIGNEGDRGAALYRYGGTLEVTYTTIAGIAGAEAVIALAGTTLTASVVDAPGPACWGVVGTGGYNVVSDATCGFAGAGDSQGIAPRLGPPVLADGVTVRPPSQHSTFADAIPAATAGLCDGSEPIDQVGDPRPGSVAGCTAGAVEGVVEAALELVVDDPGDAGDAVVGDAVCATAGGVCTLRAALDEANADPFPDNISVAAGIDPVLSLPGRDDDANASGDLDVTAPVTVDGGGATVDAAGLDRVLDIAVDPADGPVVVDELHVTGGAGVERGAGIRVTAGDLDLRNSHVHHNAAASTTGSARGGGLAVAATASSARVTGSTFEANTAASTAQAPRGGGIATEAPLDVRASTFVANAATGTFFSSGGAIHSGAGGFTPANVLASTLTGNSAANGRAFGVSAGWLWVGANVVDDGGAECGVTAAGNLGSKGGNVVADASCTSLVTPTDLSGVDPLLAPLGDDGGPTPTRRPLPGSPVIERITAGTAEICDATVASDQLGQPRPTGARCDSGAVEGDPADAPVVALLVDDPADAPDAQPGDQVCATAGGVCTLRAALEEAGESPHVAEITIAPGVDPQNTTGPLLVTGEAVIHAQGATIDGGGVGSVITARAPLMIEDATVTGGGASSGGGIDARASLEVLRTTITSNVGPGIAVRDAVERGVFLDVSVVDSTISGNTAGSGGGIWVRELNARVEVVRSTLSGNTAQSNGGNLHVASATSVVVRSSTISGGTAGGLGGSIATDGPLVQVEGSVLSAGSGGECFQPFGGIVSLGWNVAKGTNCPLTAVGDLEGVNPLLGALAGNGGPTTTHLPAAASPLVDRIPPGTVGLCDGSAVADQRGLPRPGGGGCDVGAVERQLGDP